MPITRIKRKIAHLRTQPEHVRLRAASLMTAISGLVLVFLWAVVFLPLQLKLTRGGDTNVEFPEEAALRDLSQNPPKVPSLGEPSQPARVGGIQDPLSNPTFTPTYVRPVTSAVPSVILPITSSPTPTPTPTNEPTLPVESLP